jgi:hypothetical protein
MNIITGLQANYPEATYVTTTTDECDVLEIH